jgi:hypothetical protein
MKPMRLSSILRGAPFGAHLRMSDHIHFVIAGQKAPTGPARSGRPDDKLRAVLTSNVPAIHAFACRYF